MLQNHKVLIVRINSIGVTVRGKGYVMKFLMMKGDSSQEEKKRRKSQRNESIRTVVMIDEQD